MAAACPVSFRALHLTSRHNNTDEQKITPRTLAKKVDISQRVKPQKAKFVGIGCTSNRYSNNLEKITIANPAPKKIGNKSFKLSFNSDLM